MAVVLPARDEETVIESCLGSVLANSPDLVIVVAHRCTDGTAQLAKEILGDRGVVIEDGMSSHVGGARLLGFAEALAILPATDRCDTWLLSTDADTVVPSGWVDRILAHGETGAVAVAGLAELDSWHGLEPAARQAYQELVAAGIDGDRHHHAYAANLGVRADAYLGVGGWPQVEVGEEHALLAALESSGRVVLRCTDVVVSTSGRRVARARGGLGDLLATIADGKVA